MLTTARSRLGARSLSNFDCVRGDAMALPYRDQTFDAVLLVLVPGEVPDQVPCLRAANRVLKPDGAVAISESRSDADFHPVAPVRAFAEAARLASVRRHGPGLNYTAIFRRAA